MLFEEGNDPFGEVIHASHAIGHAIAVVGPNHSAPEEFLQSVEQLDITTVLDYGEFRKYLKVTGHLGLQIDANVETSFAVDKPDNPLSV